MADKPKQPRGDMPTQVGTGTALSSSSDNNDAGLTIVPTSRRPDPPKTVPTSRRPDPPTSAPASRRADPPTSAGADPSATSAGHTRSGSPPPDPWGIGDMELETGTILAGRYEILDTLGKGGMGSVYRANDRELDRLVALKVIRPELARNTAIVDRFKQELRLSHKVTHKNVIRMYDLGEDAGMRFITMELVEGRDLRSIMEEKGKLPPAEAVEILEQTCRALEAAHTVGILHRDLKPQNIMRDADGRVVVMDFGLARTIEGDGMTQSGALVGTMEYMSPEQALGKDLDARSDIFALGLICYEMLTGDMPFRAESALASLIKRTRERANPCVSLDATIPGALSDIVSKCLECDVQNRYKDVGDLLHDLEEWDGKKAAAASLRFHANVPSSGLSGRWLAVLGAVGLVIAIGVAVPLVIRHDHRAHTAEETLKAPAISVAIVPFYNASQDPALDWLSSSLADMLSSDIGQSAKVRMVSPDRLHQVLQDLHISGSSQIDEGTLRRLAEFTNAQTLVFGQYVRAGTQIRIDTTILDLAHDTRSVLRTDILQENDVLTSVDALATQVRQRLTADPELQKELKAHADRPSTKSVDALRDYDTGLQLARKGDNLGAQKQFEASVGADSDFALAYAKLAEAYANTGHDDLAQTAAQHAVDLSDNLPASEKYLIEAIHARITNNTQQAITAYEQLATANPADTDVQMALAEAYEKASDFKDAKKHLAVVLANDPKNVDGLRASGRVEIENDNPQGGLDYLTRALSLAILVDNQQEKADILQATGVAYEMLNKPEDALHNFQESLEIKKQIGDKRGAASSLEGIASIQDSQGKPADALASYQAALAMRREIGDKEGIGKSLIDTGSFYHDHGKPDGALQYFTEALQIERELGNISNQALCLNNIGTIKVDKGDYQDGLTYLDQAYQLRQKLNVPEDLAQSEHNLAEANTKLGQYDAALALYLKAIETHRGMNDQNGVAIESDGMAKIFAAQGRYGAALSSMRDALQIFERTRETTSFTVEIVGGWGDLLAQVGRGDEGKPSRDQALNVAHQIKNDAAISLATGWIGDASFYKGDYNTARQQYTLALATAMKTSDKERILLSKVNRAKVELAAGHASGSIPAFKKLEQDADALGLKAVSVECSIDIAQASIAGRNYAGAQQELDLALARAENLGLRVLQAKGQYLQATVLMAKNQASDAAPHYREVVRILDGISKEDGAFHVLDRADLSGIYRDAKKAVQTAH
jgi:tetratricopeptide (TPR) repeat protein/predicted Ser/Thr protein kinase